MKTMISTAIISLLLAGSLSAQCWLQVTAGNRQSEAIVSDNTLWKWGGNASSQLGDGTKTDSNVPVEVLCPVSSTRDAAFRVVPEINSGF